jgi:hypothetical protein
MEAGEWHEALRLAASWPRLGEHKRRIEQGWAAMSRPDFYRELGHDPDALVADGVAALRERYGTEAGA